MKMLRTFLKLGMILVGIAALAACVAGCGTTPSEEPSFTDPPPVSAVSPSRPASIPEPAAQVLVDRFRVGDMVTISFSGVETPIAPHEERIKDDGSITLPLVGSVRAVGKAPGELQKEIQDAYVPKFYVRLVVTVKQVERVFYVGGEVRRPDRQGWFGEITVTQAIEAAGGFTDFADKTKVQVRRANGAVIKVNCKKALSRPELDPKVLPGDSINVPKRWW